MQILLYPFYRYIFFFLVLWFILDKSGWIPCKRNIINISLLSVGILFIIDCLVYIIKFESGIKTENKLAVNISMEGEDKKNNKKEEIEEIEEIVDTLIDAEDK